MLTIKPLLTMGLLAAAILASGCKTHIAVKEPAQAQPKIKALIIEGQNNHVMWPKTSRMMAKMLNDTQRFDVDITTTQHTFKLGEYAQKIDPNNTIKFIDNNTKDWKQNKTDVNFSPDFANYDVIVSNFGYGAAPLTIDAQIKLEAFVANGGGLVVVHAANNAWPNWKAYNEMTAFGGWGGRNEKSGPYVYLDDKGTVIKDPSKGESGSHGKRTEFVIETRLPNHPIMQGIPKKWLHTEDELYGKLRGPAKNMTILAYAFDEQITQKNQPVLAVIDYKKGRIFHTTLGHDDVAMACTGFITTLQRGTQWAATNKVDIPVPDNFPTEANTSSQLNSFKHILK